MIKKKERSIKLVNIKRQEMKFMINKTNEHKNTRNEIHYNT